MIASLDLPQRRARKLSLTALIDVVFILLMFFMITSSFSQWRSLDLQSSAANSSARPSEPAPVMLMRQSGELLLLIAGTSLTDKSWLDGLDPELLTTLQQSEQPLTLVPEADVTVDSIISLIAEFEAAAVHNISLGDALPRALGQEAVNHD